MPITCAPIVAALPVPQTVLACETCATGETFGVMVYLMDEACGSLYECDRCGCLGMEHQCDNCGRFAKRITDISCPMQGNDPDCQHTVYPQQLCLCPICFAAGVEIQWFEPCDILDHMQEHGEAA